MRRGTTLLAGALVVFASAIFLLSMPSVRRGIKQMYEETGGVIGSSRSWTYYNDHVQDDGDQSNDWNFGDDPIPAAEQRVKDGKAPDLLHALFDHDGRSLGGIFAETIDPRNGSPTADPGILAAILYDTGKIREVNLLPEEAIKGVEPEQQPDAAADYFEDHPESADESYEKYLDEIQTADARLEYRVDYERQYYAYPGARHGRPGIVVQDAEKHPGEKSLFIVLSWDDGDEQWIRVKCRFQPAGELVYWRPISDDTPHHVPPSTPDEPSKPDEPKPDEPKPEEPKEKDISKEYQSQHGSESPSTNGANDEDKTRKEATPDPSLEKTNPPEGHKNPPAPEPSKEYEEKKEKEEASKGTESGSKAKDEAPEDVTTNKDNDWGDYSKEKEKAHKEEHMNPDKGSSSSGSSNKSSGSSNKSSGSSSSSGSGSGSSNKSSGSSSGGQRTEATKDPGLESGSKSSGSSSGSSNKSSGSSSSSGSGSNKSSGSSNGGSTPKKEPPAPKTDSNGDNVEVDPDTVE